MLTTRTNLALGRVLWAHVPLSIWYHEARPFWRLRRVASFAGGGTGGPVGGAATGGGGGTGAAEAAGAGGGGWGGGGGT